MSLVLLERQNILLKKQEDNINKMNEDFGYLSFNAKKSKQEADRAIQDALTYQQIVRKLESELNILKSQLGGIRK